MMNELIVKFPDGITRSFTLKPGKYLIGRLAPADIVLSDPKVSSRHAEIIFANDSVLIKDLDSVNGTFVNNQEISEKKLSDQDIIRISKYLIVLKRNGESKQHLKPTERQKPPDKDKVEMVQSRHRKESDQYFVFKKHLHDKLIDKMNLRKTASHQVGDEQLRAETITKIDELLGELDNKISAHIDVKILRKELIDDALGLGPLEDLLEDESITEIMVNKGEQIFIERSGKLQLCEKRFMSDQHVLQVIQRIVAPLGRNINESSPLVDARLSDGSRVNAIIHPLALQGPTLTIRKFSKRKLTPDDLLKFNSLTKEMVDFLALCVKERKNVVISGGTGSGKTTLLNILSSFIPPDERIVTVEDAAELSLSQEHVVRLEARPPNIEGKGAIAIRDLVKNCLRMRPDRIVVGECRGGETLDMLQAMNTGHDGSLTTVHANSPRDVLSRLETMVLMSGMELPVRAIREQIKSAIDIIVQQSRLIDGTRKIVNITEVTGMEGDIITTQDIFIFQQTGFDNNGKIKGYYLPTGIVPTFVDDLHKRGINVNMEIFSMQEKI